MENNNEVGEIQKRIADIKDKIVENVTKEEDTWQLAQDLQKAREDEKVAVEKAAERTRNLKKMSARDLIELGTKQTQK